MPATTSGADAVQRAATLDSRPLTGARDMVRLLFPPLLAQQGVHSLLRGLMMSLWETLLRKSMV